MLLARSFQHIPQQVVTLMFNIIQLLIIDSLEVYSNLNFFV